MPVLRALQQQITRAVGLARLDVQPWSQSRGNVVLLLSGEGQAFFAKIFARAGDDLLDPDTRYDREKRVLSSRWEVGIPELVFAADAERVLVTRAVDGHGFKQFVDEGRPLEGLGEIARWLAGFHASGPTQAGEATLWEHVAKYPRFAERPGFAALQPQLQALPLAELVLCKGDAMAANFRFAPSGVVGLDFEGTAMRAAPVDLVALIEGMEAYTGESLARMADTVVKQYAEVRPIGDVAATAAAVAGLAALAAT